MRRTGTLLAIVSLLTTFLLTGPVGAAAAYCTEVGNVYYSFSNKSVSRILSNKRSDYLRGPGTITYTSSTTATASASMTATVSAEAGIVFAKASASLGVTVGASWSKTGTWSYTKPVPAGTTARLVMWHEARKFTVKKSRVVAPCTMQTVYIAKVNAPRAANINVWRLQYV